MKTKRKRPAQSKTRLHLSGPFYRYCFTTITHSDINHVSFISAPPISACVCIFRKHPYSGSRKGDLSWGFCNQSDVGCWL